MTWEKYYNLVHSLNIDDEKFGSLSLTDLPVALCY